MTVHEVSEATQQESRLFALTNSGDDACDLVGYPSVVLRTERGTPIAFTVRHTGDQMVTSAHPRRVELRPGHSAWFVINQVVCVRRQQSAPATRIRVALPGASHALVARIGRTPIIAECLPGDPGRVLHVSPIEPTGIATFGHP